MKQLLLCFLLLGARLFCEAQIVGAEYFWDNDPGVGNGYALAISPGSFDFNTTLNISTAGLYYGEHRLGFRTLSSSGNWSPLSIYEVHVNGVASAEYFWDHDPGVGNGQPLSLSFGSVESTNNLSLNTSALDEGNHTLYVRTKGQLNTWSIAESAFVHVTDKIIAAEYFWNNDPGVGNGTAIPVNIPSADINLTAMISTVDLDSTVDIHYLVVRTMNSSEEWSVALDTALTLGPVSVQDILFGSASIAVYPNPTSEFARLVLCLPQPTTMELDLISEQGKILRNLGKQTFSGKKEMVFDVSDLASGIYYIRIARDQQIYTEPLVIR
ncbi:MAG: T9SS type A sorting domain-containing protein [Flavobacteriales bacterium]|nr:T9SS type A sorting domain-containing protein [Flavobacteriales bacterium]